MVLLSKFHSINTSCGQYFHPYDPSCSSTCLYLTKDALQESFRIYMMAYMFGLVLRKKLPSKKELGKTALGILQSTAFLTTNASAFSFFICFLRGLIGSYNYLTVSFAPAFLASYVAINVERPSRRGLLCLYVTNVASETLFKMAVSRKLIKPIKYGDVLIFSLSIAQLLYYYKGEHTASDPIFGFLRFLIGPCEERGYEIRAVSNEIREKKYTGKNIVLKAYSDLYNKVLKWFASFSVHPSCPHPNTCLNYVVSDGGRMFLLGYIFQLGLKLLLQQRRIIRNPALLKQIIFSFDTMRLGALFSFFNIIFKTVMCTLRRQTGRDDKRFAYPAGIMAGFPFLLFRDNTIALYFMWKTFNIMYNKAVSSGYVPDIPFSTEILYSFSTAVLFHAGVLEPLNLRPSYWRFLRAISGGRLEKLERTYLEVFGFGTVDQLKSVLLREKGHSK